MNFQISHACACYWSIYGCILVSIKLIKMNPSTTIFRWLNDLLAVSSCLHPCRYSSGLQCVPHPQHLPADARRAVCRRRPSLQQDKQRPPQCRHSLRSRRWAAGLRCQPCSQWSWLVLHHVSSRIRRRLLTPSWLCCLLLLARQVWATSSASSSTSRATRETPMISATMTRSTPTPTAGHSTSVPSHSLWPKPWPSSPSTSTLRETRKSAGGRGASSSARSPPPPRTQGYRASATADGRRTPALTLQRRHGRTRRWLVWKECNLPAGPWMSCPCMPWRGTAWQRIRTAPNMRRPLSSSRSITVSPMI